MPEELLQVFVDLPKNLEFQHLYKMSVPAHLPTTQGNWIQIALIEQAKVFAPSSTTDIVTVEKEHMLLINNSLAGGRGMRLQGDLLNFELTELLPKDAGIPTMRMHSKCTNGDVFHALNCDCSDQLHEAMRVINMTGNGMIWYLKHEGRNIGTSKKIAVNRSEQVYGLKTSQTFNALGLEKNDYRDYSIVVEALKLFGDPRSVIILSNNPIKTSVLEGAGIQVTRQPIHIPTNAHSLDYLRTKATDMGHELGQVFEDHANVSEHVKMAILLAEHFNDMTLQDVQELVEKVHERNILMLEAN